MITIRTGHESGFEIYKDFQRHRNYFSPVIEGLTDRLPSSAFANFQQEYLPDWPAFDATTELVKLHFHPNCSNQSNLLQADSPLTPSDEDFRSLDGATGPGRPIVVIAMVNQLGGGKTLMLQRTTDDEISTSETDIIDQLRENRQKALYSSSGVLFPKLLELPGYVQACQMGFKVTADGHSVTLVDPAVMRRFAYRIRGPPRNSPFYADWRPFFPSR